MSIAALLRNRDFWEVVTVGLVLILLLVSFLASGCVSAIKTELNRPTPTPVPVATVPAMAAQSIVKVSQPVVYPSVAPVAESDAEWMYRTCGRELGEYWEWHRENVSGGKDMTVKVTVDSYMFLNRYQWWSDSNGQYIWQFPRDGYKFLLIFPYLEMVGEDDSQDPRYYVGDPWRRFWIQYNGTTREPEPIYYAYGLKVRIKELEERFTHNDEYRVRPFGYAWEWRDIGGWQAISPLWLRMGKSNGWSGYILFEVPRDAKPGDLKVLSQWDAFGNPWWQL